MAPIVKQTRFGDTLLTANPVKAAKAMITWARALRAIRSMNWKI